MPVSKENFGALDNGQKVQKFTLSNENGVIVEVTKFIFLGSAQPHQAVIVVVSVVVILSIQLSVSYTELLVITIN